MRKGSWLSRTIPVGATSSIHKSLHILLCWPISQACLEEGWGAFCVIDLFYAALCKSVCRYDLIQSASRKKAGCGPRPQVVYFQDLPSFCVCSEEMRLAGLHLFGHSFLASL